jgi:PAS domain S-box-containing protein
VNWIDTGLVASSLIVLAFASAGFFAWRSGSRGSLDPGPFWWWGWASLLIAGAAADLPETTQVAVYIPPVLSPVFAAFLVAGALCYRGRDVPLLLLPGAVAIGVVRAVAENAGWPVLSGVLSFLFEPTAALVTAWWVHREASDQHASWLHRAMPIGFVAIAAVEILGASRALFGLDRLVIWPLWLTAGIPLIGLQLLTGMERAERARDQSRRDREGRDQVNVRLQLLASNIHEVICEISPDRRISWVSDSSREALGRSPDSAVGRDFRDVLRELRAEEVDDEDAAVVLGFHRDQLVDGESRPRARIHKVRDGRGETRYFETRLARESPSRVLSFSRDVTDQMAAQRAIRASEERFRTFSLLGSDYCFLSTGELGGDTTDNWVTGSLTEISGYSHEELLEIGFAGFIHPEDLAAGRDRVMELLRTGGQSNHEFRILTKSGDVRWIAESLLVEVDGRTFTIYGAARDISEQRLLEQGLASTQKLESLGLLAGGIAHDFNNLLMVILGNTEIALEAGTSPAARRDLEGVMDAVAQAQSLTQQLLAYAGRGAVEHVPVDLSERVRSVSELLAVAGAAGVDLDLDLKEGLPAVISDPGEIQQLAMNLVLNAIEACEGSGRVRVSAEVASGADHVGHLWLVGEVRADRSYIRLDVSDDGVGIDADSVGQIFDPFFTTKTAGRGLGLAAVIGIVRSIDGAIRVESRLGEGTRFIVLLPASSREAAVATPIPEREEATAGRILVVDDDASVQQVAARMLRSRGFDVSTADDGASAVAACKAGEFDVVLLDAVMPGMSGAETFDAMRAVRPDISVLMVSGFDMERAVGDLLERGLAGFVGKPFRSNELVPRITALIRDAS